jgi:hypothetical protein
MERLADNRLGTCIRGWCDLALRRSQERCLEQKTLGILHTCGSGSGVTGARGEETMKKNRRTYQPRVFDNAFEVVFDAMRELIEDLWPERLYKCRKGEALNAA